MGSGVVIRFDVGESPGRRRYAEGTSGWSWSRVSKGILLKELWGGDGRIDSGSLS